MKPDLYSTVAARIVAELETGAAPWVKPWSATAGANTPCNAVTNRPYSGCNVILLWMAAASAGYALPRYVTFKQAQSLGGTVRKGEKGHQVLFVKKLLVKDKAPDAAPDAVRAIPMMRLYYVFNVSQCDGLPERVMMPSEARKVRNPDARDPLADEFIEATGADFREGAGEAFYVPSRDFISMPRFEAFKNADNFYSTAFHEMGHWTGAKSRLDRSEGMRGRFGEQAYAAEELVAELCAAFLCAEFGFDGELRHAGYIGNWIKLLRSDPRAFITAASKAQAAADHLRGLALADGETDAGEDEPDAIAA